MNALVFKGQPSFDLRPSALSSRQGREKGEDCSEALRAGRIPLAETLSCGSTQLQGELENGEFLYVQGGI